MQPTGLHHIILTVSNLAQSRAFYGDFLGFDIVMIKEGDRDSFFFRSGGVMLFFSESLQPIPGDRFDEFRIGLDHLAFTAPSKEALHDLASKLTAAGIATNGVELFAPAQKWYVAFRDPDNIQLEYWLP